ncbi:hypothetical protein JTB14_027215 [Gonioctena quinquepunctata]|nr:hypothetical protein JTB14_027215 [Gonioctena quinquepunctata]
MKHFIASHHHRLNHIKNRFSLRLEIVVNFETYEEAVAALQDTTIYFDLMEIIFLNKKTNNDDDDEEDETNAATQPVLLATFQYNWSDHVTAAGLTYLNTIEAARTSCNKRHHVMPRGECTTPIPNRAISMRVQQNKSYIINT